MKFRFYKFRFVDLVFLVLIALFYFIKDTKDAAFIFESTSILTSKNPEFLLPLLVTSPFRLFLSGLGYTLFNSFAYLTFVNLLIRRNYIPANSKLTLLFYPTIFYWLGQTLKDGFNATLILWLSFYVCNIIYSGPNLLLSALDMHLKQFISRFAWFILFALAFLIRPLQYIALYISFLLAFSFKDSYRFILLPTKISKINLFIFSLVFVLSWFLVFKASTIFGIDLNFSDLEYNVKRFLYARLTRNDSGAVDGSGSDLFNPPELILTQPLIYTYFIQFISFIFGPITLLMAGKLKIVYFLSALASSFSFAIFIKTIYFMPLKHCELDHRNVQYLYFKILVFMTITSWFSLSFFLNNAGNLFRYSVYPVSTIFLLYFVKKNMINNSGLLKKPDPLRRNLFQRSRPDKLASIMAIADCYNC